MCSVSLAGVLLSLWLAVVQGCTQRLGTCCFQLVRTRNQLSGQILCSSPPPTYVFPPPQITDLKHGSAYVSVQLTDNCPLQWGEAAVFAQYLPSLRYFTFDKLCTDVCIEPAPTVRNATYRNVCIKERTTTTTSTETPITPAEPTTPSRAVTVPRTSSPESPRTEPPRTTTVATSRPTEARTTSAPPVTEQPRSSSGPVTSSTRSYPESRTTSASTQPHIPSSTTDARTKSEPHTSTSSSSVARTSPRAPTYTRTELRTTSAPHVTRPPVSVRTDPQTQARTYPRTTARSYPRTESDTTLEPVSSSTERPQSSPLSVSVRTDPQTHARTYPRTTARKTERPRTTLEPVSSSTERPQSSPTIPLLNISLTVSPQESEWENVTEVRTVVGNLSSTEPLHLRITVITRHEWTSEARAAPDGTDSGSPIFVLGGEHPTDPNITLRVVKHVGTVPENASITLNCGPCVCKDEKTERSGWPVWTLVLTGIGAAAFGVGLAAGVAECRRRYRRRQARLRLIDDGLRNEDDGLPGNAVDMHPYGSTIRRSRF